MPDSDSPVEPTKTRTPKWRALFHRSTSALFVVTGGRRLRYANPAWEALTGVAFSAVRGTKFSGVRRSASPLWAALAPPKVVWRGEANTVRRPVPGRESGPPWWEVSYLPLRGASGELGGVLGTIRVVGEAGPRTALPLPAVFESLRVQRRAEFAFDQLLSTNPVLDRLRSQLEWAARHRAPMAVIGEAGTGRCTLARAAHESGPQRERCFAAWDCVGPQPYFLEGVLFGKGGLASSRSVGTLFLKDPSGLPRDLQTRIAQWLGKPQAPHLLYSLPKPLDDLVDSGRLIPEFQRHLATLELRVPPLRERLGELPAFLRRIAPQGPEPSEEILRVLRAYSWPGNFAELRSAWHDSLDRAGEQPAAPIHLPRFVRERFLIASSGGDRPQALNLDSILESVEKRLIARALGQSQGKIADAATRLGLGRTRLARRIEALKLGANPEETL